ncbi:MAG: tryptophan synthase subunit alpha [Anaerolineaceae bacterium]|nr:tryptophan synthase subunit alpha [Anaerolineaceae bacterium]
MANRIEQTFRRLRQEGRKAFMPFLTAGDPDLATTAALIREMAARGASLVELGLPYSDPVADGPTIQASYTRSLAAGTTIDDIFGMVSELRRDCEVAISAMGSFSLVTRRGPEKFLDDARAAGIDGLIVPDLPLEEIDLLANGAARRELSQIMLVAPTTPPERASRIAARSTGFIYYMSVTGITGERNELPDDLADHVARLREATEAPICVGFGICRPEQVRLVTSVADGAIVGSAIIRRIAEMEGRASPEIVSHIGHYVGELVAALP